MTVGCCDVSVMKTTVDRTGNGSSRDENGPLEDNLENRKPRKRFISRRSFLSKTIALGAGTVGAGLLSNVRAAEAGSSLSAGRRGTTSLPSGSGDTRGRLLDPIQRTRRHPGRRSPRRPWQ